MKTRLFLTILAFAFAASQAQAMIQVSLLADPVNCKDPFEIIATFTGDTNNAQVIFYVDNITVDTKNINGESNSKALFSGEPNWDRLPPGTHTAKAILVRHENLMDEGSVMFQVNGRRCPQTTTTTTTSTTTTTIQYRCTSNLDCAQPVSKPPECTGQNITQTLTWGECENASTKDANCVDKEETATLKTCKDDETCENGECKQKQEPTTTTTTSTTTTTTEPTTSTTTMTIPQTTTTQSEATPIFGRTNTNLDRLIEAFEAIIRIIFFWR
jgi:hypothetical protein